MDQRVVSRFEQPDEVRTFPLGRFENVSLHFVGARGYASAER